MKKLMLVLSLVVLSSCGKRPSYIEGRESDDFSGIHYMRDLRTGLCFAEKGGGNTYTMTCVPCTKEVESLIKLEK